MFRSRPHLLRPLSVALLGALPAVAIAWSMPPWAPVAVGTARPGFEELLVRAAAWTLFGCALWCAALALAAALEARTGWRLTRAMGCPAALRRWLLAGCGVALVVGLAAPAGAQSFHLAGAEDPGQDLPAPARVVTGFSPAPASPPSRAAARPSAQSTVLEVQAGDSLWALATRLAPGAPDHRVADLSRRLYLLNRDLIGPDPDLIRPGQRLQVPARSSLPHPPPEEKP